jgi:hypothetical protein
VVTAERVGPRLRCHRSSAPSRTRCRLANCRAGAVALSNCRAGAVALALSRWRTGGSAAVARSWTRQVGTVRSTNAKSQARERVRLRSKRPARARPRGSESDLLRALTHFACRHHPSAAASPWRSVALGVERLFGPSVGEGTSSLSAPNALRHFSIPKKRGDRPFLTLPARVCRPP